ncbi:MotA/TolQ/ExbB proton channel family protein [Flexithrix dorotheae]|uniref:MotA/TolQ/ExbB proton channel family protein n=1 Tax=Flexithrix dorotheae TaxID=70993 RepID=UPI000369F030|nr:MotA/TolQ/ExbB proton channel family protein [Flexithrix dorotheae]
MQTTTLLIEGIFNNTFNLLIIVLAGLNTYFFFKANHEILQLKNDILAGEDSLLEKLIQKRVGIQEDIEKRIGTSFSKWENKYQQSTTWYYLFSNTISIFPLMGIAGTILGIIPALTDFSTVKPAFSLALTSTLLGVFFSIVFKLFEGKVSANYALVSERMSTLTKDVARYLIEKERPTIE